MHSMPPWVFWMNDGRLAKFITVGMTDKEIKRMAHPPKGLGLLGALIDTNKALRMPMIGDHPKSIGFPEHHPAMTSFLGVPIRAGETQLGQIYLTNKTDAMEFTSDDEMIIQMLATYAATAIQNARTVEQMKERDLALTRRNVDMSTLDGIASTLTSSLELDEILNKTLGHVMNYMKVEAGEIFLTGRRQDIAENGFAPRTGRRSFLDAERIQNWGRVYWHCCTRPKDAGQYRY